MSDDRLDRLEATVTKLADTVTRFHNDFIELTRTNAADHAEFRKYMTESREDIERLYQAWPDHFRKGHG